MRLGIDNVEGLCLNATKNVNVWNYIDYCYWGLEVEELVTILYSVLFRVSRDVQGVISGTVALTLYNPTNTLFATIGIWYYMPMFATKFALLLSHL